MPAQLIDLTSEFFAFWEEARDRSPEEQRRLWYACYEDRHRQLFSRCGDRHGNAEALPQALDRFSNVVPQLPETIAQVRAAIDQSEPALTRLFALDRLALHWVLLVGMFWSDGWVVEVEGEPSIFIAVEMITPATPPRIELLLAHEGAHIAHARCSPWDDLETLGHGLFVEGLATVASAQLVPGYGETTYLWAGLETTWHGQSLLDWLQACQRVWPRVAADLRRDLDSTERAIQDPYFLGSKAPEALPERIGYFAGWRLVSALAAEYSLAALARWSPERIQKAMAQLLDEAALVDLLTDLEPQANATEVQSLRDTSPSNSANAVESQDRE